MKRIRLNQRMLMFFTAPATTCIASHRNYMYEITHMIGSSSSLTSLSSSDWLNGLLQGTGCGEILVTFPGQLLYSLDTDKRIKTLKWVSLLIVSPYYFRKITRNMSIKLFTATVTIGRH